MVAHESRKERTLISAGYLEETGKMVLDLRERLAGNPFAKECPTRFVLDRIADKWTVLVLSILLEGPTRFNAIGRRIAGLSPKVLSQLLKSLERDGLVTRSAFPTVPVTVEYAVTQLGRSLASVLEPLLLWAKENIDDVQQSQRQYDAEEQEG